MGEWYVEEVAGDTYVFDRQMPHAWSIPQGPPVFSLPGDHDEALCAACLAHNADIAALQAERDKYKELWERTSKSLHGVESNRAKIIEARDELADQLYTALTERDVLSDKLARMVEIAQSMRCSTDTTCECERCYTARRALAIAPGQDTHA